MIRLATPSDGEVIARIFAPYVQNTAISFAVDPPSAQDLSARVENLLPLFPFLVSEEAGKVTAYAYASPHRSLASYRWACETSIYVDPHFQRRGVASGLYRALLALLRLQRLQTAYAAITVPNPASVAFHERHGFQPFAHFEAIGYKLGSWRDVGWWQLRLQKELGDAPAEPLSFAAVQNLESARVSRILAQDA